MRITVNLQDDERKALLYLAKQERRGGREQAAVLIREALIERGLLDRLECARCGASNTYGANFCYMCGDAFD